MSKLDNLEQLLLQQISIKNDGDTAILARMILKLNQPEPTAKPESDKRETK